MINRALQPLFIITTIILKTVNTFCVHAQHIWCLPSTPYVLGIKTLRKDSKNRLYSHQMIRLIFTEQLYRACTIIKGEPYHHE